MIAEEVGDALRPLVLATSSPEAFSAFMLDLGWDIDEIPPALRDLAATVRAIASITEAEVDVTGAVTLIGHLGTVFTTLKDLDSVTGLPATIDAGEFRSDFPRQLVNHLLVDYLRGQRSTLGAALLTAGVIRITPVDASGLRPAYVRTDIDWADLSRLLSDPLALFRTAYKWGEPAFDGLRFLHHLHELGSSLGVDTFVVLLDDKLAEKLTAGAPLLDPHHEQAVAYELLHTSLAPSDVTAGIRFSILPGTATDLPGFAILPYATGREDLDIVLTDETTLTFSGGFDFAGGVALTVRPNRGIDLEVGLSSAVTSTAAEFSATIDHGSPAGERTFLFGSTEGTRAEYGRLRLTVGARKQGDTRSAYVEIAVRDFAIILSPGADADGFLATLLPNDASAETSITAGLDSGRGLYFSGSGALQLELPVHVSFGPIDLLSATVALKPRTGAVAVSVGATVRGTFGPVTAVVENVGIQAELTFPPGGGNLGPLDFGLAFKPPAGAGLSIRGGVIEGGGYLYFDPERGEYAGALELTFADFLSLKAIGLITTQAGGFSLLVIITAEFGDGIQLGYGFTLLGVGGILGHNRGVDTRQLLEGVRTGAAQEILFPRDVVANAPRLLSDLRAFFPAQSGTFVIGPLAKLGWGTPTLLTITLGVLVEIPPGNIIIAGVLRVVLPDEEAAILRLQVVFIGAIEFDKKRIYFFAGLFGSRILTIPLTGEMALLVAYGDDPNFVVSVGGFHPAFDPPPMPVPLPARISLVLVNTPTARVRVEGYFAVTSNTVQFGARAELFFGIGSANVRGHISFDALFQFSPFRFVITISASFSLNAFGVGVFSVRIRGQLEGTTPWRASGEGSISLFFFDISADFDVTWGERRVTTLGPIAVLPILHAELGRNENWRALPPAGTNVLVSLRKLPENGSLVLHPAGVLRVSQRAVPLDLTLDKVGNQKPSDVNHLSFAPTGTRLALKADVEERFAPSQYQNLSDAEKLSRPAYTLQHAGLDLSAAGADTRSSRCVERVVRYELVILDSNYKRFRKPFSGFPVALFDFFVRGASVALSALSKRKKRQLQPFDDVISVSGETYAVAFQATNRAYEPKSFSFTSEASAREFMHREITANPSLADTIHVIPGFERAS